MKLRYVFECVELDKQIVAVPVGEESDKIHCVIKLNETAAFIFDLLKEDITEENIIDAMEKEYDATREVLEREVHKYVVDFMEKGIVV